MNNKFPANLEIFILSRNRPTYLAIALQSFANLQFSSAKIIVSDNSTDDSVHELVKNDFKEIEYRKRLNLSAVDHFNQILSEANLQYLMMFHDDDIFLPSFSDDISKMIETMSGNPSAVAIATNAIIINTDGLEVRVFNINIKNIEIIKSAAEFIDSYIDPSKSIMPFPSYIYKRSALKEISFGDPGIEKYSDVTLLIKLLGRGVLIWWPNPLMGYRVHPNNDSKEVNINNLNKLIDYFHQYSNVSKLKISDFYFMATCSYFWSIRNYSAILKMIHFYISHPLLILKRIYYKIYRSKI